MAIIEINEFHGGYRPRTIANASNSDLTIAFAVNFQTAGEKLTASAADKLGRYLTAKLLFDKPAEVVDKALYFIQQMPYPVKVLNVAGNGIYTMSHHGWTQEAVNRYILEVIEGIHRGNPLERIISGGQTGADWAGGVAGVVLGLDTIMTLPQGFMQRNQQGVDIKSSCGELMQRLQADAQALSASIAAERAPINKSPAHRPAV